MSNINSKKIDTSFLKKHPIGHIIYYYGNEIPEGYMACKGQILNADINPEYLELYNAIGNVYGGSDHTNFRIPHFYLKGNRKINAAIIKYSQPLDNIDKNLNSAYRVNLQLIKCECGSEKIKSSTHSEWCPANVIS